MNSKKLDKMQNSCCGVHTLSIATNDIICCDSDKGRQCIKTDKNKVNPVTGEITYKAIVNPNKWSGLVTTYDDLQNVLTEITQEIGIKEYRIARADFAVDCFEDNYDELHKLNKCICLLLAIAYHLKNRYESVDPLSIEHLTTRVQSEYMECENYNKNIESDNTSPVYNRLEFRSKANLKTKKDIPDLVQDWCNRLDKAVNYFDNLQNICNDYLIIRWNKEKDIKVKSISEFIRKYQDNIYSSKQLINFYSRLGFDKPKSKAKNFKRYNHIEYLSLRDINIYIGSIKKSLKAYVNGDN